MKIKLKNKNTRLPRCWKSCGVDKDAWDQLQNGKEIQVKQVNDAVKLLVDINTSTAKQANNKEIK